MKKFAYLLSFVLLVGCASSKTVTSSPVGNWDYAVSGTPEGDFSGVMTISPSGTGYSGKMTSRGSDLAFDKFSYDNATKKASGEFYYSGTLVYFTATLATDNLNGSMSAGGMDFPFKATRKK